MKKGLTEIVFILDKSGSMCGLEADTVGGYNSFIEKQKGEEGEAIVSAVLFSNESEVIHDRVPLDEIAPMSANDYCVGGSTALLDAVGSAIHHIGNVHKYARADDRPEKTIFVITTDGHENASSRYSYNKIKAMIEKQQNKYGWEFIFLGANIDAEAEGERLGIKKGRAVRFRCDGIGTAANFACVSNFVSTYRCGKEADDGWSNEIEEHYRTQLV